MEIASVVTKPVLPCDKQQNTPWSFSGLFKDIPSDMKVTVLVADPKLSQVCDLEHIPRDVKNLNTILLPGVGHVIQIERPDAIMDAIPQPRS